MRPEEPTEAKYDRLKRQLQESILNQYPNPERKGCPDQTILRDLADQLSDEGVPDDKDWHHLTHCSECYREFLDFRLESKRAAKQRRALIKGFGSSAVLAIVIAVVLISKHRGAERASYFPDIQVAYNRMTVDIPAITRSEATPTNSPIAFERKPEEVTVDLPVGSKAGPYEFRLMKGNQSVVSAHANGEIHGGTTAFTVRIDLSKVASGNYSMSIRQVPWDWSYFPVIVR